jgi:hypothetical protein
VGVDFVAENSVLTVQEKSINRTIANSAQTHPENHKAFTHAHINIRKKKKKSTQKPDIRRRLLCCRLTFEGGGEACACGCRGRGACMCEDACEGCGTCACGRCEACVSACGGLWESGGGSAGCKAYAGGWTVCRCGRWSV